jgi:hypothetical protein
MFKRLVADGSGPDMLAVMAGNEGRAPRPKGGDPNTKAVSVSLTTQEWRELRLRAAENGTSVEKVIAGILRHELETMVTRRAEGQPPRR